MRLKNIFLWFLAGFACQHMTVQKPYDCINIVHKILQLSKEFPPEYETPIQVLCSVFTRSLEDYSPLCDGSTWIMISDSELQSLYEVFFSFVQGGFFTVPP